MIEGDNDALKQKVKELPIEKTEGTHFNEQQTDRRLKIWRELNLTSDGETHIYNFFTRLIGKQNCVLFDAANTLEANEPETRRTMEQLLEQNGKPCCINLVNDNDKKYLKHLERLARKKALEEAIALAESQPPVDEENLTEEEKARLDEIAAAKKELESDGEIDEVDQLIQREIEEHSRS